MWKWKIAQRCPGATELGTRTSSKAPHSTAVSVILPPVDTYAMGDPDNKEHGAAPSLHPSSGPDDAHHADLPPRRHEQKGVAPVKSSFLYTEATSTDPATTHGAPQHTHAAGARAPSSVYSPTGQAYGAVATARAALKRAANEVSECVGWCTHGHAAVAYCVHIVTWSLHGVCAQPLTPGGLIAASYAVNGRRARTKTCQE